MSLDVYNKPFWRAIILVVAAIGFVIGIILSVRDHPNIFSDLNWMPIILVALIGTPVTILLNTLEFETTARLIGQRVPFGKAVETIIIGAVANMLPIPGGTIVRIAALKSAGASYRHGTSAILLVALIWIGVAFAYAGGWILMLDDTLRGAALGLIFLLVGISALVACVVVSFRFMEDWRRATILVLLKFGLVLIDATRMFLCFLALGADASFGQASVLTAASVVGATVSIVPAGLGVREGAAALLGPLVGLGAASAYLSTSLNRLVGLAVTAPVAVVLAIRLKVGSARAETGAG